MDNINGTRKQMPVGRAFKKIIEQWQDVLASESYGLCLSIEKFVAVKPT